MPEDSLTIHVLLVDDDRAFREPLREYLERQEGEVRFEVAALSSAAEALNLGEQVRRYDVALIDQTLVGEGDLLQTGTDLMVQLKARAEELEAVIITGWGVQAEAGIAAIRRGAYRYFAKGGPIEEILLLVRAAYERREARRLAKEHDQTLAAAEAERRRANEMETLNDIGRIIATVPSLDELPRLIYREASRVLDTTNFFVAYYDPGTQENDVRLIHRHGGEIQPMRTSVERGLSGWVVRHGEPLLLPHGTSEFRKREGIELTRPEAKSWLGVPIIGSERVMGIIGAQEYEQPGKFDANHQKVLEVIARFAAAAIENAQTMARLRQEQDRYQRMVASSFDGIVAVGLEGRITEYSAAAERTLGYARGEILGESIARIYRDLPTARRINKLLHTNPDHRVMDERVEVVSRSGEVIPILLSASLLFDAAGQAIGSAGYFEDLRRNQILETRFDDLLEAIKGIASLQDPDRLAKLILSTARKAIPSASKGSLHLYDPSINRLVPQVLDGYPPEVTEIARLAPGEGFAGQVFVTRVPARIGDAARDERVKRLPDPAFHRGSAICVPLIYQDLVLGTLSLDNPNRLDAFTDDDLHLLEEYADLAAIAWVNTRQYHRRMEELQALQTVDGLLGHAPHLGKTLDLIVRVAQVQTDSRRADLYTIDRSVAGQSALTLRASAHRAPGESDSDFEPLTVREETIAYVLKESRTAQEEQPGGGWQFLAPLRSLNVETVGLLVLMTDWADAYDDDAQALASTLAQQAALALQHEAQFRALQERESQLQRQNLELEKAKQELETYGVVAAMGMFGAEITHSLAQKAFVLSNLAGSIRDLYPMDQQVAKIVSQLEEEARRLSGFPLKVSAPTAYPPFRSPLLVDEVVRKWVTNWCKNYHPAIQLHLDLNCPGTAVHVVPELFEGALRKLVENALQAMTATGGLLSLISRVENSRVKITLADTGHGIPEKYRGDYLERKIQKAHDESGMGMGVLMSRLVFRYHDGDVDLLSTGPQGTILVITLPLNVEAAYSNGVQP